MLRLPEFRRLWISLSLASIGDWLGLLATTAMAANLAHGYAAANFALGGVLVVRLIPSAVLGPLAGAFADRFDRRYTMAVCNAVRCLLFASIPLVGTLWWLFAATFLIECATLFWMPAKEASIPNLVRRDQLEAANQLQLATTYGATPVAAALLFSLLAIVSRSLARNLTFFRSNQVDLALYLNAITCLVAALTVLSVQGISGNRRNADGAEQPGILRMLREGAGFIGGTPFVRGLVVGILGAFAAAGAVIGVSKTYSSSLGGGDAAYGLLFAAIFVGIGLGMTVGPRLTRDLSRRRLFGLSIVFGGVCLALTGLMPHLFLGLITVIGIGFFGGLAYLNGMVLLGSEVDDEVRGRTFAFITSMVRVVLILMLATAPLLVGLVRQRRIDVFGIDFVLDGSRVLLVVAALLAVTVGILSYRQMDDRQGVPILADLLSALRRDTTARRRLHRGGVFIAFEGGEGVGKTTQVMRLSEWLNDRDIPVAVTYEPGATEIGQRVRSILLGGPAESLSARAEALLFAADRAQHVDTVIRPALDAGVVVISDRYVDSSLAYQGAGRALPLDEIRRLSRWATEGLVPDLTVLLDMDPAAGLARAGKRSAADRMEQESLDFHNRVRQAFRVFAEEKPQRYLVVDATYPPDKVAEIIRDQVGHLLAQRGLNGRREHVVSADRGTMRS